MKKKPHPQIIVAIAIGDVATAIYECPACGHRADLDNFDCLGADTDCVFCVECCKELSL